MISAGVERAVRDLLGDAARRARDLLACAVIEGDHEREPVIGLGEFLGLFEQPSDVGFEALALADDAHAHIALVQLGKIVADEAAQQPHQLADFGGRPRPVLRAEGEDGDELDADLAGGANRAAHGFDAAAMALAARQTARRGPAAIAVHDDGDVTRHFECRRDGARGLRPRTSCDLRR